MKINFKLYAALRLRLLAGQDTGTGAGALFFCPTTGNCLILKRSDEGDAANTWCGLGGGVDADDTSLKHTVLREASEEAGFNDSCDIQYLCKYVHDNGFVFHNHLAVVSEEFDPQLNGEHTDYCWCPYSDFSDFDMHPQMMDALNHEDSQKVLRDQGVIQDEPLTSAE